MSALIHVKEVHTVSKVHEGSGSQPEDAEEPGQETFGGIQVVSLGT